MRNDANHVFLLFALIIVILFGFWFYTVSSALSPFLLSLVIIGFLLPFRHYRPVRALIALVVALFLIWLIHYLQEIITPFIIAFALAYLFDPVVDKFQQFKLSRTYAIVAVVIFIVGSLVAFGLLVVPQFITEVQSLGKTLPSYNELKESIRLNWGSWLERIGIDLNALFQTAESQGRRKIGELLEFFSAGAEGIGASLNSIVNQLINLIIIPFATFYFLRDFDHNITYLRNKIPERHKDRAEKIYNRINAILSLYIRGKIFVAIIITLLTWILLWVFQINFALMIGLLAGFLSLIPYVGSILKFIIGIVLGLMNPDPIRSVITLLIILAIIEILDMIIISPRVIGEKIGVHPVLMIFALFVFAKLLGILGLLIAIPVTAILKVFILEWYEQYIYSRSFLGDDGDKEAEEKTI